MASRADKQDSHEQIGFIVTFIDIEDLAAHRFAFLRASGLIEGGGALGRLVEFGRFLARTGTGFRRQPALFAVHDEAPSALGNNLVKGVSLAETVPRRKRRNLLVQVTKTLSKFMCP